MINLKTSNLKKENGFSLIEALVVLFVIGIITGVTLPYFFGFYSGAELKTAGRRVASVLRAAKSYADAKDLDYQVVFSISGGGNQLTMTTFEDPDGSNDQVGKPEKIELSKSVQFTVSFSGSSSDRVTFYSNGTANNGTVTINNTDKGKKVEVTVNQYTGAVKVSDLK